MARFFVFMLAVISIHSVASANDTVCAGPKVYYRYLQADSGIMRMPATWSIYATWDEGTINHSQNADAQAKYDIQIQRKQTVLDQSGSAHVEQIYKATLTVNRPDGRSIVSDEVTCTHEQKFLP